MKIIIQGPPIPKARHRHKGKFSYDPQQKLKEDIKLQMISEMITNASDLIEEVSYHVTMIFYMEIPKSMSKIGRMRLNDTPHRVKPDLSNLCKFYEDCGNGIIWSDDSKIVELNLKKFYSDSPRTVIEFSPFNDPFSHGKTLC